MLKAASIGGSLLIIIALVIALLKAVIGFVAFLAIAIKVLILLGFLALISAVGFMVFRAWQDKRRTTV